MGILNTYMCPNRECSYSHHLKKGEVCPQCGEEAAPFGFTGLADIIASKKRQVATDQGVDDLKHESLITPEMSDEDIRSGMYDDMRNLRSHEAGSGWMRLGTLLSGSATERILMEGSFGFSARTRKIC